MGIIIKWTDYVRIRIRRDGSEYKCMIVWLKITKLCRVASWALERKTPVPLQRIMRMAIA
jgi:hypothetical protein